MIQAAPDSSRVADIEAAWQLREADPKQALESVRRMHLHVAEQSLDHARILIVEAACHWRDFRFVDMMDRLISAFEILKTDKDPLWTARLHGRISVCLTSIGDMAGAYKHLHLQLSAAAKCTSSSNKQEELFTVFHNMGRHFFVREDYARADRCYQRCYRYLTGDDITTVLLRQNHAETLARRGKLDIAAAEVEKSLRLSEQLSPNRAAVYAFGVKAWIQIAQGRISDAEHTLQSAIEYAVENDIPSAQLRMKLAKLHLQEHQPARAQSDLQPVDAIISDKGDKHDRAHYHELMSQVLEAGENFKASLMHYKIFHKTQQEIRTSEKNSRMQAEKLIDRLEQVRRQSTILKRENLELKDRVDRYRSLHEEARELSERDSLTGLYNRRMLESMAEDIIELTANATSSVTVAVVDLDHFKRINDTFGHQTGDMVLKDFAQLISTTFRSADCAARYGGEEFVLVMPHASEENAREALYRLRKLTAQHDWRGIDNRLTVTFSAGIATTNSKTTFQTLFRQADKALYYAKALGRNRICADGEPVDFTGTEVVPDIDLSKLKNAYS